MAVLTRSVRKLSRAIFDAIQSLLISHGGIGGGAALAWELCDERQANLS